MRFAPFYFFAFVLPPLLLGVLKTVSTLSDVMIPKGEPPAITEQIQSPKPDPAKPVVLILLGTQGTQITDLFASYEVLAESGKLNVFTVAAERRFLPTTGKIFVYPDFDFKTAPSPDLLVLPAILDFSDPVVLEAVKRFSVHAKAILTLSEGARLGVASGLFYGHRVTTHSLAIEDLRKEEPGAKWILGPQWVEDGKLISSPGIFSAPQAALRALEKLTNAQVAAGTGARLGIASDASALDPGGIGARDWVQVFLHAGYSFGSRDIAIPLFPGVDELFVASMTDALSRTFSQLPFSVMQEKRAIRTAHGLWIATPSVFSEDLPPRLLLIPSASAPLPEAFRTWAAPRAETRDFSSTPPGAAPGVALHLVADLTEGTSRRIVSFAARMLQAPPSVAGPALALPHCGFCFSLWLRPLALGLLGVLIARVLRSRIEAKLKTIRSKSV